MDDVVFDWVQRGARWHLVAEYVNRIGDVQTACGELIRGFRRVHDPKMESRCPNCERIRRRLVST